MICVKVQHQQFGSSQILVERLDPASLFMGCLSRAWSFHTIFCRTWFFNKWMSEPGLPSNLPKNSTKLNFPGQFTAPLFFNKKKLRQVIHAKLILDCAGKYYNIIYFICYHCSDTTCGGRNYILKWVFLFRKFWPIDIFIEEKYG